ncbi:hypothetical protein [Streptomyces sp. NPDC002133]|uniref:hypothetical protein n=1 Tax=Streptomyces sp. NPDC002133 TaxID=3154409 RepID=UPI003317F215
MRLRLLGSARLRLALLIAALAATTFTLLTSLPAHAEPSPAPSPSAPTAPGQRTPTPEEMEAIEDILREQGERLPEAEQEARLKAAQERLRKLLPDEGGVLGVFNVTDANGMPISAYTVKSDTGSLLDWDLGIQNLLTELCFMATKWLIAFCCWLITWALSFGLAKLLMAPVMSVAGSLHTRVIMEMGLPSVFLAVCAVISVARIFFGNRASGWGDAALSLLLAALATTLLASPPQVLLGEQEGALAAARGFALEVADVILDADPAKTPVEGDASEATSSALSRPLTDALTDAFIVKPAMLLQYGRTFEGECATRYSNTKITQLAYDRQISAYTKKAKEINGLADFIDPTGLTSTIHDWETDLAARWVVDHFGNPPMEAFEEQCVSGDVEAAKKASLDKLGGAVFLLIAALIVAFLITGLAGSFLVAQCRIAWDAIRGEPALIAGTIPGAGRAFLWDWCASVLRSLGQMLTSVIALAVFIIIVKAVLDQAVLDPAIEDSGKELTLRFLIVDIVCIGAIKKRKKLAERSKQVAANFRTKMSAGRIGGTHGSIFTSPASDAVTKRSGAGRATARGLMHTALVGVALAQGNPLSAVAYSMPRSMGATTLATRLNAGTRRRGRRGPGPGGRGNPGPPPRGPQPRAPQGGLPPQPGNTSRPVPAPPTAGPAGTPRRRPGTTVRTPRPRTTPGAPATAAARAGTPGQPNRSRRHVQAQRVAARRSQRAATPPSPSASGPGGFDAWLDEREERELSRRRMPPRGPS